MNWLDWAFLAILAIAAIRGFFRGIVVELASLLGIVLGIWAAARYNEKVAAWVGLNPDREVVSFAIAFVAVMLLAHLLAKLITKGLDLAQLGFPNKVAGVLFGVLRSAFILSVMANIVVARTGGNGALSERMCTNSVLCGPVRAFAPLIVPALGESKWLQRAIDEVKGGAGA